MKPVLISAIFLLLAMQVSAQTKVVRGEFTAFNKYPVANVKVISKKAKSMVTTDSVGKFQIVCKEKDVLVVDSEVFAPLNWRIGKRDNYVKANLIFRDSPKNRKIATGLGYISEDQLTYAIAHMEVENNDFCNYTDITSLIKGKFSGVDVRYSESGGQGVFVRGQRSLVSAGEAIYMVDGIQVGDISFVVPCEITSIDILKGGAAAIYGSQGANGVVVIETKGNFQR